MYGQVAKIDEQHTKILLWAFNHMNLETILYLGIITIVLCLRINIILFNTV